MRLHTHILPALAASAIALALSCAPYLSLERKARSEFQKGDYDAAVYDAASSLRYNPANTRAQLILEDAYRTAVNRHEDRVRNLRASGAKHRWDGIVSEYSALVNTSRVVRDLPTLVNKDAPGGIVKVQAKDYSMQLAEASRGAAETHYQEGARLAASADVEAQKQAALEFRAAENYIPGYKDAADRFAQSKSAGTLRVAIVPFENRSGRSGAYGALTEKIADVIISEVMNDAQATEFLQFISRDRLEQVLREQQLEVSGLVDPATARRVGKLLGAHDILTGRITQILITPERTVNRTQDQEATVVVGKKTVTDSAGSHDVDIQAVVKAQVTIYTKTAAASVAGAYSIIDVGTGAVKKTQSFENREDFSDDWATYTGDKRALGDLAELCSRSEPAAPTQAELVSDAARDLSLSLAQSLRQFFK
jgi:hypothetical protein